MGGRLLKIFIPGMLLLAASCGRQELSPWSVRMADSERLRNPRGVTLDFVTAPKWNYTNGLVCQSFLDVYDRYGLTRFLDYADQYADTMVFDDGSIRTYKVSDHTLDRVNPGKILFRLYEYTGKEKYRLALGLMRSQFDSHPRTSEGGLWHKKVYPCQMWLDGLYMGAPYYAEYGHRFGEDVFDDVVRQFLLVARHTYDEATGLYRHGWDECRAQQWADPVTGQSPHIWGRAVGWFSMALVDALDFIPEQHPGRDSVIHILQGLCDALIRVQDAETGVWYQIPDMAGREGNYLESSASSMFTYTLLKGIRKGYISSEFMPAAQKAYQGLLDCFIRDDDGVLSITHCCAVAGLGGTPYRDGSYEYYIGEPVRENDPKSVGSFIMASLEMEYSPK